MPRLRYHSLPSQDEDSVFQDVMVWQPQGDDPYFVCESCLSLNFQGADLHEPWEFIFVCLRCSLCVMCSRCVHRPLLPGCDVINNRHTSMVLFRERAREYAGLSITCPVCGDMGFTPMTFCHHWASVERNASWNDLASCMCPLCFLMNPYREFNDTQIAGRDMMNLHMQGHMSEMGFYPLLPPRDMGVVINPRDLNIPEELEILGVREIRFEDGIQMSCALGRRAPRPASLVVPRRGQARSSGVERSGVVTINLFGDENDAGTRERMMADLYKQFELDDYLEPRGERTKVLHRFNSTGLPKTGEEDPVPELVPEVVPEEAPLLCDRFLQRAEQDCVRSRRWKRDRHVFVTNLLMEFVLLSRAEAFALVRGTQSNSWRKSF